MKDKVKVGAARAQEDLTSREAVDRFRKEAADFTREATKSPESAMKVLIEAGIYTKSGKLAKNYRS